MDNKTFISRLGEVTGDKASASETTTALIDLIAQICTSLDTVAIPGFGSFSGRKTDERVEGNTLIPPVIEAEFRPSVVLRKRLKK